MHNEPNSISEVTLHIVFDNLHLWAENAQIWLLWQLCAAHGKLDVRCDPHSLHTI